MLDAVISATDEAANPSAGAAANAVTRSRRARSGSSGTSASPGATSNTSAARTGTWPPRSETRASTATSAAPASASGRVCMVLAAMTRFGVGLASVLMCAVLAAPVDALAAGNGLYSPFPSAGARKRAERFLDQLRTHKVSRAELDHGTFDSSALSPAPAGAASARAIDPGRGPAAGGWVVLAGPVGARAPPPP